MPDKTTEGVERELLEGLTIAAVYFYQTFGVPLEIFNDYFKEHNRAEQLLWYMNFRNKYPKLFL